MRIEARNRGWRSPHWVVGSILTVALCSFLGTGSASALTQPQATAGLVFENAGRIVSIRADGSERTVLTRKKAWVGQPWGLSDNGPQVSPDGTRIMFARYYDGFQDGIVDGVMIINSDGSGLRRLYTPPEDTETIAGDWATDERVYVIELREESNKQGDYKATGRLISMTLDGADRQTIFTKTFRYREKDESTSGDTMFPVGVTVAPDGRLMIESANFFENKPNRLQWVDTDTGASTLFENDASTPSFSPDGARVAFTSDRDKVNVDCYEGRCSGDPRIFIKDTATGTVTRLSISRKFGSVWSPAWSPDGDRIAFSSTHSPGGSYVGAEVWTVAPDGSCPVRLTNGSPDSGTPEWFPGGSSAECFDFLPSPLSEVTVGKTAENQEPRPLWIGPSFRGWLISDVFQDGQDISISYRDCGRPDGICPVPVSIKSGPVCSKDLSGDLMLGEYRGMERLRGGLLVRNVRRKGYVESHFYSGALETRIDTPGRYLGGSIGFGSHRQVVRALRPVGSDAPVSDTLGEVILPSTTVEKARMMVRAFGRTGSLRDAAAEAGVFREKSFVAVAYSDRRARAWLKFGRDLNRLGKIKTVKCRRWTNLPSTIAYRSKSGSNER